MRQLLFKNMTSQMDQRKVLSMVETIVQDGMEITIQRCALCRLKDRIPLKRLTRFGRQDRQRACNQGHENHFSIIKKRDTQTGQEKLLCKVHGDLYVIAEDHLCLITFTNHLKIEIKAIKNGQKSGGTK